MTTYTARGLWLSCALLFSTVVGVAGGVLSFIGGDAADAIGTGAVAFAGTTTLLVLVLSYLAPPDRAEPPRSDPAPPPNP